MHPVQALSPARPEAEPIRAAGAAQCLLSGVRCCAWGRA
jgi:hypothetical protein